MPITETWYVWKESVVYEDGISRLFTPLIHEETFDFHFETEEKAREALKSYFPEVLDEATQRNWVLCKMTLEEIKRVEEVGEEP